MDSIGTRAEIRCERHFYRSVAGCAAGKNFARQNGLAEVVTRSTPTRFHDAFRAGETRSNDSMHRIDKSVENFIACIGG